MITLQIIVFGMGVLSLYLSVNYLAYFWKVDRAIGRSMVFLMVEQVVSASGTLVFSINSMHGALSGEHEHDWNSIDPKLAIVLRILMFVAMIHSNVHLTISIKSILSSED